MANFLTAQDKTSMRLEASGVRYASVQFEVAILFEANMEEVRQILLVTTSRTIRFPNAQWRETARTAVRENLQ